MTRSTHIIDGQPYCGDLVLTPTSASFTGVPGACQVDPPGSVRPGRVTRASISYPTLGVQPFPIRRYADLTSFAEVFGLSSPSSPTNAWPGSSASILISGIPSSGYIALAINTTDVGRYGIVGLASYNNTAGTKVGMSVSATPGDFTREYVKGIGESFPKVVVAPKTNGLPVQPGQTFYLNLRFVDGIAGIRSMALTNTVGVQP